MNIAHYIKAARLRTLPLSVSGIIVGCSSGDPNGFISSPIFWLAIVTTIGFQVISNFANDYGDGVRGTDNDRKGEKRMVASGLISPKDMKRAVIITSLITFLVALSLIYLAFGLSYFKYFLLFLILGIASILAAIRYTVGDSAYGYSGYGDLFVFLFFGLLSVVGSSFLFTKTLDWRVFLPAFTVGMLSTAVLNLNNMRDRFTDQKVGKRTLAVKLGPEFSKYYHYYLIIGSLLFALSYVLLSSKSYWQLLIVLAYIPLIKHLLFVDKNKDESKLDSQLKIVALSTFAFAVLFGIGQTL